MNVPWKIYLKGSQGESYDLHLKLVRVRGVGKHTSGERARKVVYALYMKGQASAFFSLG